MSSSRPIKVFVSYSHDSPEHKHLMLQLANRLREDGVDCMIDRYVPSPPQGWQRWTQEQITRAEFIILICTETYCRRFSGDETPSKGRGVNWESQIISQLLYDKNTFNEKFIPVLPDGESEKSVPTPLRAYTIYRYPSGYTDLYRKLTNQPEVIAPTVGQIRPMPPLKVISAGAPETSSKATYKHDVFLLYSPNDKAAVEELADRLHEEGITSWRGISPGLGESLQKSIYEGLADSRSCAIFWGPSGDPPWRNEELRELLWRRVNSDEEDFRAIPILLPRAERPSRSSLPAYLTSAAWVEFRFKLNDNAAFCQLCKEITGVEPAGETSFQLTVNPYRGLQAFNIDDDRFFFGREVQTQWLLEKLRTSFGARKESRFLAILGPSGSGKSSLARAGLLASLKRGEIEGSSKWLYTICQPGSDPLESLAIAVADVSDAIQDVGSLRHLIDELNQDYRTLHLTSRLANRQNTERLLVILVDQFEEVFTLCDKEEVRQAFFNNLFYAANVVQGQTVIIITMRTDFYGKCAVYSILAAMLSDRQMLIGPMSRSELRSAIERPAQLVGCKFERGLVSKLLDDAEGESGALPLLQHALLELWEKREGRMLTYVSYESIGRIEGSLERRAEDVYALLDEHEKLLCRRIMLRLTQPGEGTEDTKRRTLLRELLATKEERAEVERIISVLAAQDARLVTTNSDANLSGEPVVEISHEALIRGWARLRGWIEESREGLRTQRQLTAAASEWLANGRNESFLYSGARLARALEWYESHGDELNDDEREFLKESREHDARGRRLSDSATLDQLEAMAKEIWFNIPEMIVWLNRARGLMATLPDHKRQIEKLKREIKNNDSSTGKNQSEDAGREVRHLHDTITVFVRRLELFNHTLMAAAEHVVNVTDKIYALTIEDVRVEWEKAIASIADVEICPHYGGLLIKPQTGLVPIGPDPVSGLWEFAHLQTGAVPRRAADGHIIKTEDMAVILVLVPGGVFNMGATLPKKKSLRGTPNVDSYARPEEIPVHSVSLGPFFISKYQMTQGQWLRATGTNLSAWKTQLNKDAKVVSLLHPIEFVSWHECAQALRSVKLIFPTEAQWEYAARAGTTTIWWKGDDPRLLVGAANFVDCREPVYSFSTPTVVGLFKSPNPFGLHDVAGNVWEWCGDKFGSYNLPVTEKDGERLVPDGKTYVCRGGSFFNTVEYGRSAVRYYQVPPDSRFNNLGVRPARSLEE